MTNLNYNFLYAYGQPDVRADFKLEPSDFRVTEELGFEFSGSGEHVCVLIEKTGLNTNDVGKILSRHCHVAPRDISYAGLKDRQAVTRQWFSLRVGMKRELDFTDLSHPALKILEVARNIRKIKRGSHTGNHFTIRLKNLRGDSAEVEERGRLIQHSGVPNYFGSQRFGKSLDNVDKALAMFQGEFKVKDRFLRGIYLSAARAWLFNTFLSTRVENDSWNNYVAGDVMSLAGSASNFVPEEWDAELIQRLLEFDIHPSGPMWGSGDLKTLGSARELESQLENNNLDLCQGLVDFGLKQERRAMRLCPLNMKIYPEAEGHLVVEFSLGKGSYATSALRELVNFEQNSLSENRI